MSRYRLLSVRLLVLGIILFSLLTAGYGDDTLNANFGPPHQISPFTKDNFDQNGSWKNKLSSDLLQLIDPQSCPTCQIPSEIATEMAKLSQLRYDADNLSEVKVTLILKKSASTEQYSSILNDSVSDPMFGMVTGWVHISALAELANRTEVQQIITQLLPVGNSIPSDVRENQSKNQSDDMTGSKNPQVHIPLSNESTYTPSISESVVWKKKLSTDILQLLDDSYLSPGQTGDDLQNLMIATGELKPGGNGSGEVMISARALSDVPLQAYLNFFTSGGFDQSYGNIAGWISISNLSLLAKDPGIISIMAQIPPLTSRIITQGDHLLHSDEFRNITNCTGKGVKVGIISDGLSSLSKVVADGELPTNIHILRNSVGGDEGTSMLQIVHDIAPDAELYFHDRGSSQIEFVHAMDALINEGCNIICDDITYIEPFFEDGYVARNVKDRILSYGILYITSAGNFAQEHYQAPFNPYSDKGYMWHDFKGTGDVRDLKFSAPPHSAGHVILQWDDQYSKSSNNYDLFLYNSDLREIGRSVKIQDGDDDPLEFCRFVNEQNVVQNFYVRVVQAGGENKTIEMFVLPIGGNSITLDPCIPEDSMMGLTSSL